MIYSVPPRMYDDAVKSGFKWPKNFVRHEYAPVKETVADALNETFKDYKE
jgi:hypothetical protein